MADVTLLAQVPLFASLSPDQLAELTSKLTARSYRRGQDIFHQGDPGSVMYMIKSGQVKISTSSLEGEEAILAILTSNDFFGELSLLDGKERSASATAMAPTEVLALDRSDFLEVLRNNPQMAGDVLAALSDRLRRTDVMVEDVVFLDLATRLAKRLLELAEKHGVQTDSGLEIDLRVTQQDLADAVGASRVAVNKQLGLYQDEGILHVGRQCITLLRPDELRKLI
jgi:CRP/FNR family cyclic AMP-dependent transcriptional regulator